VDEAADTNTLASGAGLYNPVDGAADTNTLLPGAGLFNPLIRAANTNAPAVHSSTFWSAATLASDVRRFPCYLNIIVSITG
jgi:hypothetical protein